MVCDPCQIVGFKNEGDVCAVRYRVQCGGHFVPLPADALAPRPAMTLTHDGPIFKVPSAPQEPAPSVAAAAWFEATAALVAEGRTWSPATKAILTLGDAMASALSKSASLPPAVRERIEEELETCKRNGWSLGAYTAEDIRALLAALDGRHG